MSQDDLRFFATNETVQALLDELEQDAFNRFMAAPGWLRWKQKERQRMAWLEIEAIRNLRSRIRSRAVTRKKAPVI